MQVILKCPYNLTIIFFLNKMCIDLKWREMYLKVIFPKWPPYCDINLKTKLGIDLKWLEMPFNVIFGNPCDFWAAVAIL